MITDILLIIASLILLYFGASWLVRGAGSLAFRLGITPLVIGLTIVAYGTSSPELIVSVKATMNNNGGISIGNVVGSNIFNIGIVLGFSALAYPVKIKAEVLRFDIPVMLITSVCFLFFFLDHTISRLEGIILIAGGLFYTIYNVRKSKTETNPEVKQEFQEAMPKTTRWWVNGFLIILGLGILMYGSGMLVDHAVNLARQFQVSDAIIGLTIVAAGTSMPELATSVVAAFKKQSDIALGNVVGSNIFNILIILGVSSLISPIHAPDIGLTDSLVMIGISIVLIPLVKTGFVLKRWEAAILILLYIIYLYHILP